MKERFVYFIRPIGGGGPVKIGCSALSRNRLETIMTWAPVPLEIAAETPGDFGLESRIHGLFAASHTHHEWFRQSAELDQLIADIAVGKPIAELIDLSAPIIPLRPRRKRSDRLRLYMSYVMRLCWAFKPYRQPTFGIKYPEDINGVIARWSRDNAVPTTEQFARLEEVIADPQKHGVPYEYRRMAA